MFLLQMQSFTTKNKFDSDDFKRELFNDMMNQAKDEAKRTQRNPFEV